MLPMNEGQIDTRGQEIGRELEVIANAKGTNGRDLEQREGELLEQLDALEYGAGVNYFAERDGEGGRRKL